MVRAPTRHEPKGSAEQDYPHHREVDDQLPRSLQLNEVHSDACDDKGHDAEQ